MKNVLTSLTLVACCGAVVYSTQHPMVIGVVVATLLALLALRKDAQA